MRAVKFLAVTKRDSVKFLYVSIRHDPPSRGQKAGVEAKATHRGAPKKIGYDRRPSKKNPIEKSALDG